MQLAGYRLQYEQLAVQNNQLKENLKKYKKRCRQYENEKIALKKTVQSLEEQLGREKQSNKLMLQENVKLKEEIKLINSSNQSPLDVQKQLKTLSKACMRLGRQKFQLIESSELKQSEWLQNVSKLKEQGEVSHRKYRQAKEKMQRDRQVYNQLRQKYKRKTEECNQLSEQYIHMQERNNSIIKEQQEEISILFQKSELYSNASAISQNDT